MFILKRIINLKNDYLFIYLFIFKQKINSFLNYIYIIYI